MSDRDAMLAALRSLSPASAPVCLAGTAALAGPVASVATGTAVNRTLSVIDSTDFAAFEPAIGFPASFSDFHDFAYAYTVGS